MVLVTPRNVRLYLVRSASGQIHAADPGALTALCGAYPYTLCALNTLSCRFTAEQIKRESGCIDCYRKAQQLHRRQAVAA